MPRMKIRLFGRRRDAGGVAVVVGILLSSGVLLGVSAMAVDVGQLYVEREQLQSGADAAAMAVALDCIHGRQADCKDLAEVNAKHYADLNSADGVSHIDSVCGQDPQGWLASCGAEPDNFTKCLAQNPLNTQGWVRVRTSTETAGATGQSRFILPPIFAQTLAGYTGSDVGACSRVAWGTPDTSFAFAVCENIFNQYTNFGADLAPAPPATHVAADEHKFYWRNETTYTGLCSDNGGTAQPSEGRWPIPADFGWNDRDFGGTTCDVDMSHDYDVTQLVPDSPPYTPDECYFRLRTARATGTPIPVLVIRATGGIWAEVRGVAAFVVTGYRIQDRTARRSRLIGGCRTGTVCVIGYFTGALIPGQRLNGSFSSPYGTFGAAPDLGASVVQTVG